jgi:hypothetical protein
VTRLVSSQCRSSRWVRVGLTVLLSACGGISPLDGAVPDAEAGAELDVGVVEDTSVMDAALADGTVDGGTADGGADLDADLDANCLACPADNPCLPFVGCSPDCVPMLPPTGSPCPGGTCNDGVCFPSMPGCGDGVRSADPREGCDDGFNDDGDACSSDCVPTLLTVASNAGTSDIPATQLPAMAADGTGDMLFVWLGTRVPMIGEPYRRLLGRRFTSAGHPLGPNEILIEDHVGVSQPVRPAVAGQGAGWVVTWRSTAIEGAGGEQGGIAYRAISHDGVPGATRQANTTELFDQLDPVIATLSTGFVIVWTDFSSELVTGDLRLREFDAFGTPRSGERSATSTTSDDQSHAVIAARGDASSLGTRWALAFVDSSTASVDPIPGPRVRLRRFDGGVASDATDFVVAHAWSAEPTLAMTATGTIVGWTGRADDVHGDIYVRRIEDAAGPPVDDAAVDRFASPVMGTRFPADGLASVAPFPLGGTGYVVVWHTDSRASGFPGGRMGTSMGLDLPPEVAGLSGLVVPGSQFSMVPTTGGLWIAGVDSSMTGVPDAFVAYLLPWD